MQKGSLAHLRFGTKQKRLLYLERAETQISRSKQTKKEINNMDSKFNKKLFLSLVDIREHEIVAKKPLYILIDASEHKELIDTGDSYQLIGTFKICDKQTEQCTITPFIFEVQVPKIGDVLIDKKLIRIEFEEGDVVIKAEYKVLESDLNAIRSILENRIKYFKYDITQQLTVLEQLFSGIIGAVPLTYFEIILSELYRCPDDISKPVRLCGSDYKTAKPVDIKKAIHINGTLERAIGYGYSKEAISTSISSTHTKKKDSMLSAVKG